MEAFAGQRSFATYVIEVTEFNSEARCNLRGRLEATMASEVTKMDVIGNMGMATRVIEVIDFKSEASRLF